jgi:hypothetical protein
VPLTSAQVNVVSEAPVVLAELATVDFERRGALVANLGPALVYVGPADVTTTTGFRLSAGAILAVDLEYGDALYGICPSGLVATVHVLTTG